MCGICLILKVAIQSHRFLFDFFQDYGHSPDAVVLPLNEHIMHNQLLLSDNINLKFVASQLMRRGPDHFYAHVLKLESAAPELVHIEEVDYNKVDAIGMQSILHLRGNQPYCSNANKSYFLYNGEIWDTGLLPSIEDKNDSQWLHQVLQDCLGLVEKMLQVLRQIRGDFAIILVESNNIYIMKDFFGKRSLLVGMSASRLVISSCSMEPPRECFQLEDDGQDENKQSWRNKYQEEWLSGRSKRMFEVPANSLIHIAILHGEAVWQHHRIDPVVLANIVKEPQVEEGIIQRVISLLMASVRQLVSCTRKGSQIAVLFSGGVDSTLIARLLDLTMPSEQPIDLVNLAFRADAPDRASALSSYGQLSALNPIRKYNLILLDKNLQDIDAIKEGLLTAIYPKTTHMDFNIAGALHLASRGTAARIVLTGLGADEIFSGYSRYRVAYNRDGWQEIENEMLFDMERLWIRNLGRDDRAITANGRQARYPFLYLPLWLYLRSVHISQLTKGIGEKMILCRVAKELGLAQTATIKKKAIQFGTRLAKLSNVNSFGSNRKAKGTYQYV